MQRQSRQPPTPTPTPMAIAAVELEEEEEATTAPTEPLLALVELLLLKEAAAVFIELDAAVSTAVLADALLLASEELPSGRAVEDEVSKDEDDCDSGDAAELVAEAALRSLLLP
jgi:hypothetical protein